jgi:GNAT superfamily N-acetyltransferase
MHIFIFDKFNYFSPSSENKPYPAMDKIKIRYATEDDLHELLQFEQEVIRAERPMDPTIRKSPVYYYELEEMIHNPDVALVVAELDGKLLASGYACSKKARSYLDHDYCAYLGFMYTIPEFRGKGVNRRIIEALRQWALARGLKELRLTVYDLNDPAIRAYEKVGFRKHIIEMRLRKDDYQ